MGELLFFAMAMRRFKIVNLIAALHVFARVAATAAAATAFFCLFKAASQC